MGSSNVSFKTIRENDAIFIEIDMKRIVSFKVDEELAAWIERTWREQGYVSRSDFLRELVREVIRNKEKLELQPFNYVYKGSAKTITFKLDRKSLECLDRIVEEKGYYNRSDLIRDVLKKLWNRIPDGSSTRP